MKPYPTTPRSRLNAAAFALFACTAMATASHAAEWSYAGAHGPEHWGDGFPTCSSGRMQSPIDLAAAGTEANVAVSADYAPGALTVTNNGHTVQANFDAGSYLVSAGRVFNLLQVHFHTPSEHLFSGRSRPLVAHFVHADTDGSLAVLGVTYVTGRANPELQKLIDAAPRRATPARTVQGVNFNPAALLPSSLNVFRYMGSLTTPPCSEGVHWHVVRRAAEASQAQINALRTIMGMNARPVHGLNGRLLVAPAR